MFILKKYSQNFIKKFAARPVLDNAMNVQREKRKERSQQEINPNLMNWQNVQQLKRKGRRQQQVNANLMNWQNVQ